MSLLSLNNGLSFALVVICWWLAHQNALNREPFGTLIAVGYSLLALFAMANAMLRNMPEFIHLLPISLVLSKAALVATLGLVAVRLGKIYS